MKILLEISIGLFFLVSFSVTAQQGEVNTRTFNLFNTELRLFGSSFVDDTFHIIISLPDQYDSSDKRYPVLYVLDGDISYGIAAGVARYLEIGGNIPELIVVGIGYGSTEKSAGNKRNRDYRLDGDGEAENFNKFLTEELITYIDDNFRTVKEERTISGYSLGGLFALYSLFSQPGLFNNYIVGSPYLLPGDFAIFDFEEQAALDMDEVSGKIFISVGSEASGEKYFNPIDELVTIMQEREYPNLEIYTKVFDGSTHLAGPPEVVTHGLISVFGE
jgi:predicted alpha/beta superfamily hydrolase